MKRLPESYFLCECIGHFENSCEVAFDIKETGGKWLDVLDLVSGGARILS